MSELTIVIKNLDGKIKAEKAGTDQLIMVFEEEYEPGDSIIFKTEHTNCFYVIRVDDGMDESFVYLTKAEIVYDIPFDEKKISYSPKSFTGDRHYITIRKACDYEVNSYKNLAKNVMDQHGDRGCFPHASANVETRGEAVFAARNAIDGVLSNESHGSWPYESWGINRQDDAAMTLAFGRPVDIDQINLCTRADFPHDNWWVSALFTFSDGSCETVSMEKSEKPHVFDIKKEKITWLKLSDLVKADDPSPFPALTQIEVYGKES